MPVSKPRRGVVAQTAEHSGGSTARAPLGSCVRTCAAPRAVLGSSPSDPVTGLRSGHTTKRRGIPTKRAQCDRVWIFRPSLFRCPQLPGAPYCPDGPSSGAPNSRYYQNSGAPRCPVPLVARCPSLPGAPRCPVPLVARCPPLPGAPRCPVPSTARCPQLPGALNYPTTAPLPSDCLRD